LQHSLVIGARGEIGAAVVETLLARGDRVAALDIRQTGTRENARLYQAPVDVCDGASVGDAVQQACDWLGQVDACVNAAGMMTRGALFDLEDADFEQTLAVNLTGAFRITRAIAAIMREAGQGSILHITSIHAQTGMPNRAAYAASKGGVVSMVRALAAELGPFGISINALSPGPTGAGMGGMGRARGRLSTMAPLGRVAHLAEVGDTVAFLTSDSARAISGQVITMDCGLTSTLLSQAGQKRDKTRTL